MVWCLGVTCHSSDQSRVMVGYMRLLLVLAITLYHQSRADIAALLPMNVRTETTIRVTIEDMIF